MKRSEVNLLFALFYVLFIDMFSRYNEVFFAIMSTVAFIVYAASAVIEWWKEK